MNNLIPNYFLNEKEESPYFLVVFLICLVFFASCFATAKFTKSYFSVLELESDGIHTTGTIVQRIKEPRNRARTLYYLRYAFENKSTSNKCTLLKETLTTPKNKACKITYRTQPITETQYRKLSTSDKVDVLYLPSRTKSRSIALGLRYNKNEGLAFILIFFIISTLSGLFLCREFFRNFGKL